MRNAQVQAVRAESGGVRVDYLHNQRPESMHGDYVVCAVPHRILLELSFDPPLSAAKLAAAMAGTAEREHDLVLDLPSTEDSQIHYVLPAGHEFSRVPAGKTLDTPVGKFSLEVVQDDDGAVVRSRLQLTRPRITPAEYDAFRQFLRQVDASLEQSFEVTPER